MSKKTDIKTCRYVDCKHENKKIDISQEEYKADGKMYYHTDCYYAKKNGDWKDEQTKKDLQYIKNQWVLYISQTVIFSQLFKCLNDLIARGISSNYLVFVLDYVIKNKLNLKHPQGFKYYVDKDEIKDAYKKQQLPKADIKKQSDFVVKDSSNTPTFKVNQKPSGFKSILGGGK